MHKWQMQKLMLSSQVYYNSSDKVKIHAMLGNKSYVSTQRRKVGDSSISTSRSIKFAHLPKPADSKSFLHSQLLLDLCNRQSRVQTLRTRSRAI